ncbi:MAG: NADP(H)-dependent aldo-keto reductase [Bacteroidetes bacterium]|nr:NADP(H)-dependent aldo-keto reductase [Bacteroidota bacterium]
MQYTKLPNTSIKVSKLCLGSMTWGEQNTQAEGHAQLDYAFEQGINFIDTAEMYSVPGKPETQGSTETIIGNWISKNKIRDKVILTTKITGPNPFFEHIRKTLNFSKEALDDALHKSLKRLQTDYLDLYLLHWPERNVNIFGKRNYSHKEDEQWKDNISEILERLEGYIKQGKIRNIGLSNDTPFGVMRFVEEARKGKTKITTVQNPYNLLNRKDEVGLTEILHRENIGYMTYSPLGFGQLTGKYLDGATPEKARVTLFPQYSRYHSDNSFKATQNYNEIAKKHGISLTHMSLAFIRQQSFVTSTILGATTMEQLSENIDSIHINLSDEILSEINLVHEQIPNPAP